MTRLTNSCGILLLLFSTGTTMAQALGDPDRNWPGDAQIQQYLATKADELNARFLSDVDTRQPSADERFMELRRRYLDEYLYMLGLSPLPERTPLQATVTGSLKRDGYRVDMLHFQSRLGLYVTGNLYRPSVIDTRQRLPAVLYVCGHSPRGRNGNKTAYQSHGIWFARHGYICLTIDTLQLGEIPGTHHGTYREGRWWWWSRGFTPAGVECWNGMRALDYLSERRDVDAERMAVTGISGGGAATFWITAADPRVKLAVPVSGMADLPAYVGNRVINGHCDCMFLHNAYRWPWTRIAALITPRPLLFVNSDQDGIFPMDANHRIANRLEQVYSLFGAGDQVDTLVSIGGHAYREDIRRSVYRFMNLHLKNDPSPVDDSEVDLVTGTRSDQHPIPPEQLRVFPTDDDLPDDAINGVIDQTFVPVANVVTPAAESVDAWKEHLIEQLRSSPFRTLPRHIAAARLVRKEASIEHLATEEGIEITLEAIGQLPARPQRLALWVDVGEDNRPAPELTRHWDRHGDAVFRCRVRGSGSSRWTRNNPPNYVERSLVLLGQTVETGQLRDIAATAGLLRERYGPSVPIRVVGQAGAAILGAYAAVLEPAIDEVVAIDPPLTHNDPTAPAFLNILRVCDVPHVLALLAPRPLTLSGVSREATAIVRHVYHATGGDENLLFEELLP